MARQTFMEKAKGGCMISRYVYKFGYKAYYEYMKEKTYLEPKKLFEISHSATKLLM
jgi:hypothetical protein